MSTSNTSTFIPLTKDPDPDLPDHLLKALIRAARRPTLSKAAKQHAQPYARRAQELLTAQEGA
jgi:hypothetical protein